MKRQDALMQQHGITSENIEILICYLYWYCLVGRI